MKRLVVSKLKKVGTSFVGIADVVGVREVGGDVRGDIEVVAVEVKMTPSNFGKILGQALGYSLFLSNKRSWQQGSASDCWR